MQSKLFTHKKLVCSAQSVRMTDRKLVQAYMCSKISIAHFRGVSDMTSQQFFCALWITCYGCATVRHSCWTLDMVSCLITAFTTSVPTCWQHWLLEVHRWMPFTGWLSFSLHFFFSFLEVITVLKLKYHASCFISK